MRIAFLTTLMIALIGLSQGAHAEGERHCFFANQFENWKAADEKTLYIRVGVKRYFRLDLAGACRGVMWPNAYLITEFKGSNTVCSAIDWDLQVSQQPHGIPEGCIVAKMTELTPSEVEALPRKLKP